MGRSTLQVADIVREHRGAYEALRGGSLPATQSRVLDDIVHCRTAFHGGHLLRCNECGHEDISYNSCRNRHCPKCQAAARVEWLAQREKELLPVQYFHVVFTLPQEIAALALQNKRVVYQILLRTSAETLRQIAADPKHLGAEIGFLSVLHTWGQTLLHHPHVHCVVPGGGLSPDGSRWISCPKGFFLPVRVLSPVFRGKFLEQLRAAHGRGELVFHGKLQHLDDPNTFRSYLAATYKSNWVVYAKPPFGGPEQVLKYLARYTHRVAISNRRILTLEDGKVSFSWKDYANGSKRRVMTLDAVEFLRRFLLHVLPKGFVRLRHYGLLSNRARRAKLQLCRELLGASSPSQQVPNELAGDSEEHGVRCPACKKGNMVVVMKLPPKGAPVTQWPSPQLLKAG